MATVIISSLENISHVCLCQMLYPPAQKVIWKLMAHRKPVSVTTGEIKVWARGDSQEGKGLEKGQSSR